MRAKKVDANQPKIVEELRKAGAWVWIIHQPFDLLVAFNGELHLMEVKTDKGGLNAKQTDTLRDMVGRGGYMPHIVRSVDEALKAIGANE